MRYISLFAGIGGFDLALNRLGHECVWANEWDKYAAQIYNKNFGKLGEWTRSTECVRHNGDSSDSKGESWEGNKGVDTRDIRTVPTSEIPDHDLLVGGFPCQAFSIAGKRRGFDDTRGTLFFEIARILKDKQPKFFILENVKGLLSHDTGFTFKTIISTLTELGYDLEWQVLNSKNYGVPQNRERVFIVGHIRGQPRPEVFPIRESDVGDNEKQLSGKETYGERDIKDNKGGGGISLAY
jgi:DNA (cytosine-5)-methyltransferase 1